MILIKIFKALAGLDSEMECIYNYFNRERKEEKGMEIFKLAQLMKEAGFDFYFNYDDFGDALAEDDQYMIETQTGELIGARAPITVFQTDNGLEILDMRPARGNEIISDSDGVYHSGLSVEASMVIIEKFFKEAK